MKGVEISAISLIQCLLHSALLTLSGGEVAEYARRCTLMCSVMSIVSVVADVFEIIAVVSWEGLSPGGIDLCR